MSISITQFKSLIAPKLHGTSVSKVSNINDKLGEAAGNMLLRIAPPETIRSSRIENAIYNKVYNYVAQDDMGLDSLIDVRPIGQERTDDTDVHQTLAKDFDFKKELRKGHIALEYINGSKTLRIAHELTPRTVLHELNSLTIGGTVTFGGDATDETIDTLDYKSGDASVKFGLSGATGEATVTINLDNTIDLSDMKDLGALFHWLKFPDISRLTNVKLEWGSSDSKYWHSTETAFHDRSFANLGDNAWGLLRYDWADASSSGSPDEDDSEVIDHMKITITYTAGDALSNVRLDCITAALGEAWEALYYSQYIFTDSTGETWKEQPTVESDLIVLDRAALNILIAEFMMLALQELKGKHIAADTRFFSNALEGSGGSDEERGRVGLYDAYNEKYPDQSLSREMEYYAFDSLDG